MLSTFPFVIRKWHCFAININLDPGIREANSGEL